jgi:hypothetical protein
MALKLVYVEIQYILYFYYQKHRSYDGISKIQKNLMDWKKYTTIFTSLDAQFNFTWTLFAYKKCINTFLLFNSLVKVSVSFFWMMFNLRQPMKIHSIGIMMYLCIRSLCPKKNGLSQNFEPVLLSFCPGWYFRYLPIFPHKKVNTYNVSPICHSRL